MLAYDDEKISELDAAVRARKKAVDGIERTTALTLGEAMRRIERARRRLGHESPRLPATVGSTPPSGSDDQSKAD